MRIWAKRAVAGLAIYVIALQAVLVGLSPLAISQSLDPLNVICHSDAGTPAQPPADRDKGTTCDHCVLCNVSFAGVPVAATAPAPLARAESTALPLSAAAVFSAHHNPASARGPPLAV